MTDTRSPVLSPPLPGSAWALAWSCLSGQVVLVADRGLRHSEPALVLISMVLGAVLVAWVSAGVLRARIVPLALAWVLLVISLVGAAFEVVDGGIDDPFVLLNLATAVAAVVALGRFCTSDYVRIQRSRPAAARPPIGGLLAIAVVVGLLGGLVATADGSGSGVHVNLHAG